MPTLVAPPNSLRDRLTASSSKLGMLPDVAMRAMKIADLPESSGRDLATVIERDVHLTADILRLANSPLCGSTKAISSLHEAILRLGFRKCKNLIVASGVASVHRDIPANLHWVRDSLWRHGFATAIAAVHLNRLLGLGFQGEEFTGGLLHDVGRTLLAVAAPEEFSTFDAMSFVETDDLLENERAAIDTDHCDIGGWFARSNGLPEALVAVIEFHHRDDAPDEHRNFVALISAADHIANHLQRHLDASMYDPESNIPVQQLEENGIRNATGLFAEFGEDLVENTAHDFVEVLRM